MTSGCNGLLEKTLVCFPEKAHDGRPEDFGLQARDLYFETQDRVKLHGWLFVRDPQAPFLLWCHGNAGNISHRLDNIARLQTLESMFLYSTTGGTEKARGRCPSRDFTWMGKRPGRR